MAKRPPQHMLSIEVSPDGRLRLVILCSLSKQEFVAQEYDRESALRFLAELEAEIRKAPSTTRPA